MINTKAKKDNKGLIILGAAGLGLVGWMLLKGKAAASDIIPSGEIGWTAAGRDYAGIPSVVEGNPSSAIVTVTNASISDGVLCGYEFKVQVIITDAFGKYLSQGTTWLNLKAGETGSAQIPFHLIPGYFGGMIAQAKLLTTDGATELAATNALSFNISETTPVGGISLIQKLYWDNIMSEWKFIPATNTISLLRSDASQFYITRKNDSASSITSMILVSIADINLQYDTLYLTSENATLTLASGGTGACSFLIPALVNQGTFIATISVISGSVLLARTQITINT